MPSDDWNGICRRTSETRRTTEREEEAEAGSEIFADDMMIFHGFLQKSTNIVAYKHYIYYLWTEVDLCILCKLKTQNYDPLPLNACPHQDKNIM